MAATARATPPDTPHIPVLLGPLLAAVAPVEGVWLDGTFGAAGYSRGLLEAGASRVSGIDRDPLAFELAAPWAAGYGDSTVGLRPGGAGRGTKLCSWPIVAGSSTPMSVCWRAR